ncbi:hypothetical protein MPSEU_000519600 [Mayamaea pseudoterrestris]|nr:hypothetical protein MPSEU_000519600 [Mayamaea pseudoterrestris]
MRIPTALHAEEASSITTIEQLSLSIEHVAIGPHRYRMTMKTLSLFLFLVVTTSLLHVSESFSARAPMTMVSLRLPSFGRSTHLNIASTADDNISTRYLREIEKKEAVLSKRREEAMAKLSQYEETLSKLSEKKAEYLAASQVAELPDGGSFSETTMRSVVKAFLWRIVAGSITFVATLQFTGSVTSAIQVVMGDFFSKAFTMFLGERLMNRSQAGRKKGSDAAGRSLAKALIWRLFAICNTLCLAVFVTKDMNAAAKVASVDALIKTALMFFYERVWARINWGKEFLIDFAI